MIHTVMKPEKNFGSISPTSNDLLYESLHSSIRIMGILNVTPDSFSDGGQFLDSGKAADHAQQLIEEGADIVDVGGESSRPGSDRVPEAIEVARVIPVIQSIRAFSSVPISVDTTKSRVAEAAMLAGADIINDISGGTHDPAILDVAVRHNAILVLMHMQGNPKTMQDSPVYEDVTQEVRRWLSDRAMEAKRKGVQRIVLDPGFGFGKTTEHNFTLLAELRTIADLGFPVLVGTSRKSFLGQPLGLPTDERLEGTLVSNILALERGATIIRVHDVRPMKRAIEIYKRIHAAN